LKPDAVIIADPGILMAVQNLDPRMPIHLSTQANATNAASAMFWHKAGVERIVLARELSLSETISIRHSTPSSLQFEIFVHGAMCMSYSGRCMLSYQLTGRDANRGDCAQPCRWKFFISEEKRDGEYYPVEEDERGTYLFNSRDLCLLRRVPELLETGVCSYKIEGRMKSPFYVATVVKAWREAIDMAWAGKWNESDLGRFEKEVAMVSNRGFTEGFIDGTPGAEAQKFETGGYVRNSDFIAVVPDGMVAEKIGDNWRQEIEQRNRFYQSDQLECLSPEGSPFSFTTIGLYNIDMTLIEVAPHPQMRFIIDTDKPLPEGSMIRRPVIVEK